MQYLNKIQLRGIVGRIDISRVAEKEHVSFSLLTERAYTAADGNHVVEVLWTQVSCFPGPRSEDALNIRKGDAVEVTGRLRARRYTDADGIDRFTWDIVAGEVKLLAEDHLLPE